MAELKASASSSELVKPAKRSGRRVVVPGASGAAGVKKSRSRHSVSRMADGESSVRRDVGGNIERVKTHLASLLGEAGANSVEGAMKLQRLVSGDHDDTAVSAQKRGHKATFGAADAELLAVLDKAPADRNNDDLMLVEKHCAWHDVFADVRPMLRRKMFKHLRGVRLSVAQVVLLQGDAAESCFVVYQGEVAVHCHKAGEERKLAELRANPRARDRKPLFMDRGHLADEGEKVLGSRTAVLKRGAAFGEAGLDPSGHAKRSATIIVAADRTVVFELLRADLLGDHGGDMMAGSAAPGAAAAEARGFGGASDADLLQRLGTAAANRTAEDVQRIDDAVGWHPFLAHLDAETRQTLLKSLTVARYERDDVVMLQDDEADAFYILYDGEVDVLQNKDRPQQDLARWKIEKMAEAAVTIAQILEERQAFLAKEGEEARWEKEFSHLPKKNLPRVSSYAQSHAAPGAALKDQVAAETLEGAEAQPDAAAAETYSLVDSTGGNCAQTGDGEGWALRDGVYVFRQLVPRTLAGREVARLRRGASFGENGLQADGLALRSATVVARSDAVVLLKLCCTDILLDFKAQEEADEDFDDDEFQDNEEFQDVASDLRDFAQREEANGESAAGRLSGAARQSVGQGRVGRSTMLGVLADTPPLVQLSLKVTRNVPKKKADIVKARKKDGEARDLERAPAKAAAKVEAAAKLAKQSKSGRQLNAAAPEQPTPAPQPDAAAPAPAAPEH
ncbi:hypothetical protein M885DRAFT_520376 [Pelagophyceae sp. CCMP2097]|nr:hypothetical protein M885DRAFT_520376 [Pelagophyceae sp. CCMP2097]